MNILLIEKAAVALLSGLATFVASNQADLGIVPSLIIGGVVNTALAVLNTLIQPTQKVTALMYKKDK